MTIAQLKRHMDRRFDRLERTKADRKDLRGFATKRDFRRFATKRDLRRFATKRDLRRFATKHELEQMRDELRRHFEVIAEAMFARIDAALDGIRANQERMAHHDIVLDEHERRITHLESPA